jgi:hypothetical protein
VRQILRNKFEQLLIADHQAAFGSLISHKIEEKGEIWVRLRDHQRLEEGD